MLVGSGARKLLTASNPRRVGQGSRGLEGSLVDGMAPRQGQREGSLPGLHEMVRGLGGRNALKSMGAGRAMSPCEWSTGDTVGWLWNGVDPLKEPRPGGCNGGAQRPPCQDGVVLQHTSCVRAIRQHCGHRDTRSRSAGASTTEGVLLVPEAVWLAHSSYPFRVSATIYIGRIPRDYLVRSSGKHRRQ